MIYVVLIMSSSLSAIEWVAISSTHVLEIAFFVLVVTVVGFFGFKK